jgi:hypothetical protein
MPSRWHSSLETHPMLNVNCQRAGSGEEYEDDLWNPRRRSASECQEYRGVHIRFQ